MKQSFHEKKRTISAQIRRTNHLVLISIVIIYAVLFGGGVGWLFHLYPSIIDRLFLLPIAPFFCLSVLLGLRVSAWHVAASYSAIGSGLCVLVEMVVEEHSREALFESVDVILFIVIIGAIIGLSTFIINQRFRKTPNTDEYPHFTDFWFQWVLASTLGATIGWFTAWYIILVTLGNSDVSQGISRILFVVTLGYVTGASLGVAQWLVLKQRIDETVWWILASSVGLMFGLVIGSSINLFLAKSIGLHIGTIVVGGTVGAFVGGTQWFILRQYFVRSEVWVLANTLGWCLGGAVNDVIARWLPADFVVSIILPRMISGAVAGAVTGGALIWLIGLQNYLEEEQVGE